MKPNESIAFIAVLSQIMLQCALCGNVKKVLVEDKKVDNWNKKRPVNNELKMGNVDIDRVTSNIKAQDPNISYSNNGLKDLLQIIQYVVVDVFNNTEFRTFMTKRFLHNYVRQADPYFRKIKNVTKLIDSKPAKTDAKIDMNMKVARHVRHGKHANINLN
ncbi:uncharacterized protein LOC126835567 [Adelges cooleyi]|uniref:uncharacterized protein LOC126835567 n=1 Tax=Adelges cooleyi TaxID=133065 RepID=UPI00217F54F7|nr:uncharacterized protein LOC126835567 [Adelges cooleyi]XP_050424195.1 uncharacterized protein LOC126835567 [Adelges cooleyi]